MMSDNTKQPVKPLRISAIDFDHPTERGCIRTHSGLYVNFREPDPATICLDDIIHGLSNIGRYGGQSWSFYPVAEHCLHVSAQLYRTYGDNLLALCGLLHDAPEAYFGDVVGPLKRLLPEYMSLENNFARVVEQRFHLPYFSLDDPRVDDIDKAIVPWEMSMIRDCRFRKPSDPGDIRREFKRAFYQYGGSET